MNKQLAVVGSPISHSKSPIIHKAAYGILNQEFDYSKIQVEKNHLMQFVETLDPSWLGLSVTAPLKAEALRLASTADDAAKITGVANTLLKSEAGWSAFNTDVFGIQRALQEANVRDVRRVSILGTGATARSAALAIASSFPGVEFYLAGRNKDSLAKLRIFSRSVGVKQAKRVSMKRALRASDLVISTLPAKALDEDVMSLKASRFSKPKGLFFDVAYDPWPSEAAKLWSKHNLPVISGVEMLLWQAMAQVRIFCGGDPNSEVFNEPAVMLSMRHAIGLI